MVVQVDLQADPPLVRLPADTGGNTPRMEIEFEVVSVYRPRLVRVTAGSGEAATREYRVPDEGPGDEGEPAAAEAASPLPEDESLLTIVLWAYYEACHQGARVPDDLPWRHPRRSARWHAFETAMRAVPDRDSWWSDASERLQRARAIYRGL